MDNNDQDTRPGAGTEYPRSFAPDHIGRRDGLTTDLEAGAHNLLQACLGAKPGEKLLVLAENPDDGFYDEAAPSAVVNKAKAMQLDVTWREVPVVDDAADADPEIWDAMRQADRIVFFARLGDQVRFDALPAISRASVIYAMDAGMLGSGFGTSPHGGYLEILHLINRQMAAASNIRLTCPMGTDISGAVAEPDAFATGDGEVTIRRFPMAVFKPVPASGFNGRVVIHRFLTGTGHRYYEPYNLLLDSPVTAEIEAGRVTAYTGPADQVERVRAHTGLVSEKFSIDPDIVHSWHAGMHPGCAYLDNAFDNLARWGNAAFGNPRILHFHTCGDYAPGEISWNVTDPTIELDGIAVWSGGRLHPERLPGGPEILQRWPDVKAVFDNPRHEIGL